MYLFSRVIVMLSVMSLFSCTNKKDCYKCELKTTAKVGNTFYHLGTVSESKCDASTMDVYMWESGKTNAWKSSDTEYMTRAKCIK